jgi:glycosidase
LNSIEAVCRGRLRASRRSDGRRLIGILATVAQSACTTGAPTRQLPATWTSGPFLEVFVRAYQDSDGDGIGDLRGLTHRLDYIKSLGVTGIWLMPITESQDHDHGYAVVDYRAIEPAYGTLADLDTLVREAHARGIGIIMDYVMNHSAARHPFFVEASQSTAARVSRVQLKSRQHRTDAASRRSG